MNQVFRYSWHVPQWSVVNEDNPWTQPEIIAVMPEIVEALKEFGIQIHVKYIPSAATFELLIEKQ